MFLLHLNEFSVDSINTTYAYVMNNQALVILNRKLHFSDMYWETSFFNYAYRIALKLTEKKYSFFVTQKW